MNLIKRIDKGPYSDKTIGITGQEHDANLEEIEKAHEELKEDVASFKKAEAGNSFDSAAEMTNFWTTEDAAGRTPIDTKEFFRKDLNQFWKWDSTEPEKAVFSRDSIVKATEISSGNTDVAVSGDVYNNLQSKSDLEASVNKLNIAEKKEDYYVSESGSEVANTDYLYVRTYDLVAGKQYTSNENMRFTCYYDINDNVISGGSSSNTKTFTAPANIAYADITLYNEGSYDVNAFILAEGTSLPIFEPYKKVLKSSQLEVKPENIKKNLKAENLGIKEYFNRNLFNKDSSLIDIGTFINSSGDHSGNATYDTTGLIEIPDGVTEVIVSYSHNIAFRDSDNVFISYLSDGGNENVVKQLPTGTKYIDCTILTGTKNDFVVLIGSQMTTDFKAYSDVQNSIPKLKVAQENIIASDISDYVCLPKEIPVAVGRTIEVYNHSVSFYAHNDGLFFLWTGLGKSMSRKWSYTGHTDDIGDTTLTLQIFNKKNFKVFEGTTVVKVASATITNPIKVCARGDSLSNDKPQYAEIKTLSSNQISFVGTRGAGVDKHEGRSGIKAVEMLGEFNYTGDTNGITGNDGKLQNTNPFWNPNTSQIDFNYYKSNYNLNPDVLFDFLGTNGIAINPDVNAGAIKTFIDNIRATGGATIPIYVAHTLYRGSQNSIANQASTDGYEANTTAKIEEDLKVFNLHKKTIELLESYPNLYLVPLGHCNDSENNYKTGTVAVNPRSTITEDNEPDGVHPQDAGYLQIADVLFSSIAVHQ